MSDTGSAVAERAAEAEGAEGEAETTTPADPPAAACTSQTTPVEVFLLRAAFVFCQMLCLFVFCL